MEIQNILDLTRFKMSDLKLEVKSCSTGLGASQGFAFLEFCPPKCLEIFPELRFWGGDQSRPRITEKFLFCENP